MTTPPLRSQPIGRAAELIERLGLAPHPEGGWYRECFRSPQRVDPLDGRPARAALTTIDFLLPRGEHSAWHRVRSDEVWHLLEGGPLRLWQLSPDLKRLQVAVLRPVGGRIGPGDDLAPDTSEDALPPAPRAVVPAGWWQAAEPLDAFAYVGATVAPGFDFADFDFLRDEPRGSAALQALAPQAARLL